MIGVALLNGAGAMPALAALASPKTSAALKTIDRTMRFPSRLLTPPLAQRRYIKATNAMNGS
jgi:hypothetical protein